MDSGRTINSRGDVCQASLAKYPGDTRLYHLTKSYLGIVLRTKASDHPDNTTAQQTTDRRGFIALCDVLVVHDGNTNPYWTVSNVQITPSRPTGLDDFEEALPRGCSNYINGEPYSNTYSSNDVSDLDGDWCVVSFIGGNERTPYVSNWWPSPRNTFDPQTLGYGSPDSTGKGRTLAQAGNGRFRHFKRVNGVEYVVTPKGDVFFSTNYAGGGITPNPDTRSTKGRFSREDTPPTGGGVRINIKTNQAMELSWNPQEDGIGLNDQFDAALPQTNPQAQRPYTKGSRAATYIKIQNALVSIEVPSLFNVKSSNSIRLESGANFDIIAGGTLRTAVNNERITTVNSNCTTNIINGDKNLTLELGNIATTVTEGGITETAKQDIFLTSTEGSITKTAKQDIFLTSTEGSITLTSNNAAIAVLCVDNMDIISTSGSISVEAATQILLGGSTASANVLKGSEWTAALTTFTSNLAAFVVAAVGPPGGPAGPLAAQSIEATALTGSLLALVTAYTAALSTKTFVGP